MDVNTTPKNRPLSCRKGGMLVWRRHMGIEPTSHDSRRSPTGFEDQAHHQTGSASALGL